MPCQECSLTGLPAWAGPQTVPCIWSQVGSQALQSGRVTDCSVVGWLIGDPSQTKLITGPWADLHFGSVEWQSCCWGILIRRGCRQGHSATMSWYQYPLAGCSVSHPLSLLLSDRRWSSAANSSVFPVRKDRNGPPEDHKPWGSWISLMGSFPPTNSHSPRESFLVCPVRAWERGDSHHETTPLYLLM